MVASLAALEIPEELNLGRYLLDRQVRAGRGSRLAIVCGEHEVTYAQALDRSNRVANALRELGVRREERVLLLLHDGPDFVYAFLGAIKLGAVPIPTNTMLRTADYAYLLRDSRARAGIVQDRLLAAFPPLDPGRFPELRHVVVAGDEGPSDVPRLASLMAAASGDDPGVETNRDDAAFWLYSSGTTGFPKGAVHLQHDAPVTCELYARQVLGIGPDDRTFSVAKLFFAYGLGNALTFPFSVGATTILHPGPPAPADVYAQIERHRPTLFFSVPTSYAQLLAHHREGGDFDLSSIRLAVSAGEALPKALYERFRDRFGVEILDGIGSTEILHIFLSNRPGEARPGSSGQPVPGYEARIEVESGREAAPDEVGNLLIKGDSTCAFYWNQHERTKATIEGHWIRTGDKYWRDEDGFYWYAGRADDMLKVGGIWVSPIEIEGTLAEHPAVLEAAVVGRRDQDDLEKPAAYVVLAAGHTASPELARELQDFVRGRIAEYKRPRWVEFVPELPKTATGKTQRFRLRAGEGA